MHSFRNRALVALVLASTIVCSEDNGTGLPHGGAYPLVRPDGSGDFATIQDAVDHVGAGDTIFLSDGRFVGVGNTDIELRGADIVIRSQSGVPENCVIDCAGSPSSQHRGFWYHLGEGAASALHGITIEHGFALGGGAAVLCEDGSSPTFKNVHFRANGRVAVTSYSGSSTFHSCLFEGNFDGALSALGGAHLELYDCSFLNNYVDGGGAAVVNTSSFVTFSDCIFRDNSSTFAGGAIFSDKVSTEDSALVSAEGCTFVSNVAGFYGGAIRCGRSDLTLEGCLFMGNTSGNGGGALDVYSSSSSTITACTFFANSAPAGSAIRLALQSNLNATASIVAFNLGGASVLCDTLTAESHASFGCTDIFGNEGGDWAGCIASQLDSEQNISADPLFCNTATGDIRLQDTSPCRQDVTCGIMGASTSSCDVPLSFDHAIGPQARLPARRSKTR